MICIMNILVHGKTPTGHDELLDAFLVKLAEVRITLIQEKCKFSRRQLKFAGPNFSAHGTYW